MSRRTRTETRRREDEAKVRDALGRAEARVRGASGADGAPAVDAAMARSGTREDEGGRDDRDATVAGDRDETDWW